MDPFADTTGSPADLRRIYELADTTWSTPSKSNLTPWMRTSGSWAKRSLIKRLGAQKVRLRDFGGTVRTVDCALEREIAEALVSH